MDALLVVRVTGKQLLEALENEFVDTQLYMEGMSSHFSFVNISKIGFLIL